MTAFAGDTAIDPETPPGSAKVEPAIIADPAPGAGARAAGHWLLAHKFLAVGAVIAVAVAVWLGAGYFAGTSVAVDVVQRGDLIETVVASGHVETPYRAVIGSQMTGTVANIPVSEGQAVHQGQLLVALDSHELTAQLIQARGAVAQAEAHMRQLRELTLPSAIDARKAAIASQLGAAQVQRRAAALAPKGFITRATLDNARNQLDIADSAARTAQAQVQSAGPGGSDYVSGETELAQARAGYDTAKSRLAYANITAPRDGVLISRNVERGTVVSPGTVLMVLAPIGVTQLVLQIDERNLGKLALGQAAIASADAYPGQRFAARIAYINPGIDITRASMQVKLIVDQPPATLRQDMTVSVDIAVARRNNVLTVPNRSIRGALSPQPWVMAIRDGRAVHLPVRIGLQGNSQTEIITGLAAGDTIIPASSPIVAGKRVRPAAP